jgi:Holliday junction DNA helicase RuvA
LNVLSGIPARDLRGALAGGDVDRLCRIPGVGKKTAERLVLELRERSREGEAAAADETRDATAVSAAARDGEAVSALVNLGYKRGEAERVMRSISADVSLEDAIREALRRFAR